MTMTSLLHFHSSLNNHSSHRFTNSLNKLSSRHHSLRLFISNLKWFTNSLKLFTNNHQSTFSHNLRSLFSPNLRLLFSLNPKSLCNSSLNTLTHSLSTNHLNTNSSQITGILKATTHTAS